MNLKNMFGLKDKKRYKIMKEHFASLDYDKLKEISIMNEKWIKPYYNVSLNIPQGWDETQLSFYINVLENSIQEIISKSIITSKFTDWDFNFMTEVKKDVNVGLYKNCADEENCLDYYYHIDFVKSENEKTMARQNIQDADCLISPLESLLMSQLSIHIYSNLLGFIEANKKEKIIVQSFAKSKGIKHSPILVNDEPWIYSRDNVTFLEYNFEKAFQLERKLPEITKYMFFSTKHFIDLVRENKNNPEFIAIGIKEYHSKMEKIIG